MIPIGQGMLRRALREHVAHHHLERNRQGLGNTLITRCSAVGSQDRTISRRSRLGGILNYYEQITTNDLPHDDACGDSEQYAIKNCYDDIPADRRRTMRWAPALARLAL
jgi:hypothetical protein